MTNSIGYIKLYRCIADEEDEFWLKERFTQAQAWIDILLNVTHKPIFGCQERRTVQLEAGEMLISTPKLAKRWHWHRHTVSSFLNSLLLYNRITIRKEQGIRVLHVESWSKYQDGVQPTIQPTIQPTENTPININKKERKRNIKKDAEPLSSFLSPQIKNSSVFPELLRWEAYKNKSKKKYRMIEEVEAAAKILQNLSGGDVAKAEKIVDYSICGGFDALYPIKEAKETSYDRYLRDKQISRPRTNEELLAEDADWP